jgi:eukaryotic-like serine/threonine-protein kinase
MGFEDPAPSHPPAQPGPSPLATCHSSSAASFGDYELLEEIGHGGMGVVYKARQKSLDRMVALKLLLFGPHAPPESVKRFRAEAVATAALQHPNIVAIHEVGFCEGQHFIAMDYVEGRHLGQVISDFGFRISDFQRRARWVKTIAEAIHYAHERGILHRDLKPANVMIDANDQPRVTDFGLAKRLEGDSELTVTGQVLGSPNYMPPEQATGKRGTVSRRSDVYALGAILYHALTIRPPFVGEGMADTVQQVLNVEPVSPRVLNPSVPADLETVCLKCLEKEPSKRYATAQMLAEELGRFLEGKPVLARPVGRLAKTWRWCRRNPRLASATGVALLSVLIGLAGVSWQWRRAAAERARAEAGELSARQNAYAAEMNQAQQALAENNWGRARELLDHYRPRPGEPDLRSWEWRYLWQQCRGDEQFTLIGHSNRVHAVAFSPEGRWLASAAADDTVRLWDLPARSQVAIAYCRSETYNAVLFSPDAQRLFTTAAGESVVRIWRVPSFEPLGELRLDGEASRLALSPDGRILAAVGARAVKLWRTTDGQEVAVVTASTDLFAGRLAFSPDGQWLAANDVQGSIFVWDWKAGSAIATLTGHTRLAPWGYVILALGFAGDGKTLVSAGSDSTVRLWDVTSGRERKRLDTQASVVTDLAFSPDRRVMATAGTDQTVKLWDVAAWQVLGTLQGHLNEVWAVAFSPDGTALATGGKDDTVKLWSTRLKPGPVTSRALPTGLGSFRLTADGSSVLLAQTNGLLAVLEAKGWRETSPQPLPISLSEIAGLAVAPGGRLLAVGTHEGPVRTWTLPDCRPSGDFLGSGEESGLLVFSGDGTRMAAASADRTFRVWEVANRRPLAQFSNEVGVVKILRLSATGDLLGVGYGRGLVEVREMATRRKLARLAAHKEGVHDIAFLSHPPQLVTASADGTVKIWDLGTQRLVATLRGSLLGMNSLAVSPDERRLAAGAGEGIIKLWDLASRQEVATFRGHRSGVQVAFTPDGNDLVTASQEAVSVWHAPSLPEIEATEKANSPVRP